MLWAFGLVIMIVVTVAIGVSYALARKVLVDEVSKRLSTEASEKSNAVDSWLYERSRELHLQAFTLFGLIAEYNKATSKRQRDDVRNELRRYLRNSSGADDAFHLKMVLHPETAEVLVATDVREEGKFKETRRYFQQGKEKIFVQTSFFRMQTTAPSIVVATPIRSLGGTLSGVLVGFANLSELASIVEQGIYSVQITASHDSYIIDKRGIFVTPSKFMVPGVSRQFIKRIPFVDQCLHGGFGQWNGLDYRDVPVISAFRWLPGRELCLIIQVDQAEVLVPANQLAMTLIVIAFFSILGGLFICWILALNLSKPLLRLRDLSEQFGAGDLHARLYEARTDEIGQLGAAFNAMADALQQRDGEIQSLNQDLHDRIVRLQEAQAELVKREKLATLGRLTATVSHELRNPLAAMSSGLAVLRRRLPMGNERVVRAMELIVRNIKRCDRIIDEMLDFTRSHEGQMESTVLDEWLSELLEELDTPAGLIIEYRLGLHDSTVLMDRERMRRAFINVFENSCQSHGRENDGRVVNGAHVRISSQCCDSYVEVVVEDNGSGIAEDVLPKIFEPLFSTKSFGIGLGMPIVKQIMEQMHGGIKVDSVLGEGTRVVLWLPLMVSAPMAIPAKPDSV